MPRTFFDYFQIAALLFFTLVAAGRALHLRVGQRINPITIGVGKKGTRRITEFGFLAGFVFWVVAILSSALHLEFRAMPVFVYWQVMDWLPARLLGAMLVTLGFAIFLLALVSFGSSWRVGIDEKAPGELVSRGVFAISRNPIYASLILYAVGAFLINGTLCFIIFAVLMTAGVHYQILQEEKFLLGRYGQAYQAYCARTGRYFTARSTSAVADLKVDHGS